VWGRNVSAGTLEESGGAGGECSRQRHPTAAIAPSLPLDDFNNHYPLIQPSKYFPRSPKNRPPDPSKIRALDFKGEFRQSAICSVSATIDIYWSYFYLLAADHAAPTHPQKAVTSACADCTLSPGSILQLREQMHFPGREASFDLTE
jgi:hypothetical protein